MLQLLEEWEICGRNSPADTEVSVEGGRGVAPGPRAEILLQPVGKSTVSQGCCALQPMGEHSGAEIHLQPLGESALKQVDVIWSCRLWRDSVGDELFQALGSMEKNPRRSRFSGMTCNLSEAVHSWRTVLHWKDPCWRTVLRIVSCRGDSMLEQGNSMRRRRTRKEVSWIDHNSLSPLPSVTWGEEAEVKVGMKINTGRRMGCKKRLLVLLVFLTIHICY